MKVHSDRGYLIREVVNFIFQHGANLVGTVKQPIKCWPFTYDQVVNPEKDKRTLLFTKGAPTLF